MQPCILIDVPLSIPRSLTLRAPPPRAVPFTCAKVVHRPLDAVATPRRGAVIAQNELARALAAIIPTHIVPVVPVGVAAVQALCELIHGLWRWADVSCGVAAVRARAQERLVVGRRKSKPRTELSLVRLPFFAASGNLLRIPDCKVTEEEEKTKGIGCEKNMAGKQNWRTRCVLSFC